MFVPLVAIPARPASSVFEIVIIMPLPLRSLDVCAPLRLVKAAAGREQIFF